MRQNIMRDNLWIERRGQSMRICRLKVGHCNGSERLVGMAYSKCSKDLFTGEIYRVRVCKDVGLNFSFIFEFIGGMGVPKGLPGGKKIGRD